MLPGCFVLFCFFFLWNIWVLKATRIGVIACSVGDDDFGFL